MQITIYFTDKNIALLEKSLMLENQERLELANTLESYSPESAEQFRQGFTLQEYIHSTLMNAVEDEVNFREQYSEEATS